MEFKVKIDQFDGPLDLMLHLIKEQQLDLMNLDIVKLADQYLAYIHAMQKLRLDIAGEYLAQLAALLEYKSQKLLPTPPSELDDNYEEDESALLVKRLIEYQKYKEVSTEFEQLYEQRSELHDKPQSSIAAQWVKLDETYGEADPYALIKAMNRCLTRLQIEQPYEVKITKPELTVDQRRPVLAKIMDQLPQPFMLEDTMKDCTDIYAVVITFLCILDMIHDEELNFTVKGEQVYFRKKATTHAA
jgi:segregation and condensation protein A